MRLPYPLSVVLLSALGCQGMSDLTPIDGVDPRPPDIERSTVAMGVARLSARHVAALLKAIDEDTRCGFASDPVKGAVQVSGMAGDDGTATWTVDTCKLNFATEQKLDTDCDGAEVWVSGVATVSATRTVKGVLTKDMMQPVAPDAANSASLELHVSFDGFSVRQTGNDSSMTVKSGELSVTAVPQLMPDHKTGVCTIATPDLALHALSLTNAVLTAHAQGHVLDDVSVPTATLEVQVGQGSDHENWLDGKVTVWETEIAVPVAADHDGLDPKYNRDDFIHSFACNNDLQQPLGGACPPPREKPAQGAAALSVQLFAAVAKQAEKDTQCGFGKPGMAGTAMGGLGEKSAMVFTLPAPCTLTFAPGTVVDTDCGGKQTILEGSVTVTGSKTVSGYLVGDPAEPVVPASTSPVAFSLKLEANELKVTQSSSPNVLTMHSGSLSGTLAPKTGLDKGKSVCSIVTPIAHVTLSHQNAAVEVDNGSIVVPLTLQTSSLEAQSGTNAGKTNYLAGTVQASGQMLKVPSAGAQPVLDPDYDAAAFTASFMCDANLAMPASEDDCSLAKELGQGAARTMIRDVAAAIKLINDNGYCGFQNQDLLQNPFAVGGDPGSYGTMAWGAVCNGLNYGARQPWTTDCNNVVTTIEGGLNVGANRWVNGFRDEICGGFLDLFCVDTIHPYPSDAVTFQLQASFNDFGVGTDEGRLIIHSGSVASVAHPMQGQRASTGEYDVGTPVAGFDNIDFANGSVSLVKGPKTFKFDVAAAHIVAFSGAFDGHQNELSGAITVDGVVVPLGMMDLQPNYTQPAFDQTYACTSDLVAVLKP